MRVYRLSSQLSDDGGSAVESERMCLVYLIRFICNKLLIIIKEIFLAFRCVVDCMYVRMGNLQYFIVHNPPAVLFLFNIALFIIILSTVTLSLTASKNIKSTLEWRNLLDGFLQLELCIVPFMSNTTFGNIYPPPSSLDNPPKTTIEKFKTHHLPIRLSIHPTLDYLSTNSSHSSLSTSMYGKYMGLKGAYSQTIINITLTFEHHFNASCSHDNRLIQAACHSDSVLGCVSFTAPLGVFPEQQQMDQCPAQGPLASLQGVYKAGMNWQLADVDALYYCRSRTIIKGNFDGLLTTPKSSIYEVKPTTKAHLFDTTIILFLIFIIFLLYATTFQHNQPHRSSRSSSANHSFSED